MVLEISWYCGICKFNPASANVLHITYTHMYIIYIYICMHNTAMVPRVSVPKVMRDLYRQQ